MSRKPPVYFQTEIIGTLQTAFKDKFGIPRQPGLAPTATGILKLNPISQYEQAVKGLETFTHIWVIWIFHGHGAKSWKASIRPPRLGGKKKMGVFASRSPHRPNPIGLSVVKLEKIDLHAKGGIELHVSGIDMMDGTPVLDIKPYVPYADIIPDASSGWIQGEVSRTDVQFTPLAESKLEMPYYSKHPRVRELITEILELDPRPPSQKRELPPGAPDSIGKQFGIAILDFDVKWEIRESHFLVTDIEEGNRFRKVK